MASYMQNDEAVYVAKYLILYRKMSTNAFRIGPFYTAILNIRCRLNVTSNQQVYNILQVLTKNYLSVVTNLFASP